ncbi:unnamed protein product [Acanthoscelides obtectus]|uniref:Uncharacterized protein n=1 Tax=Acanthoscelides obtectus TaxID=200917 RepID=A0A9P0NVC6_ACAOB|nr:unnamed protein product [Acanthoscelides obtectus]CAK1625907.1 hypothetical protein AOBTE_LOCUS3463 [Acanthoscelides obtectus]
MCNSSSSNGHPPVTAENHRPRITPLAKRRMAVGDAGWPDNARRDADQRFQDNEQRCQIYALKSRKRFPKTEGVDIKRGSGRGQLHRCSGGTKALKQDKNEEREQRDEERPWSLGIPNKYGQQTLVMDKCCHSLTVSAWYVATPRRSPSVRGFTFSDRTDDTTSPSFKVNF